MFAHTHNYGKIYAAISHLTSAEQAEKMCIVHGSPGLGKSEAVKELARILRGIYFYCAPGHTPRSLCLQILDSCQQMSLHNSTSELIDDLAKYLRSNKAPLFLDDCDNLTSKGTLLETVRAVHDLSGQPVIMVGMTGFLKKVSRHPQVLDRSHIVEFTALTLQDIQSLSLALSDIRFDLALCQQILAASQGKHRLAVRAINYCNRWAISHHYDEIDLEKWGNQPLLPRVAVEAR